MIPPSLPRRRRLGRASARAARAHEADDDREDHDPQHPLKDRSRCPSHRPARSSPHSAVAEKGVSCADTARHTPPDLTYTPLYR